MSEYPTQDYVKGMMATDKWPAKEGEILDIRSLSDKEIKVIELYNQEEIIKQLKILNEKMGASGKVTKATKRAKGDPEPKPIIPDNVASGDEPPGGTSEK